MAHRSRLTTLRYRPDGLISRNEASYQQLEILRNLYQGVQVCVVDPEDEYLRLADAVGGAVVRLGAPA